MKTAGQWEAANGEFELSAITARSIKKLNPLHLQFLWLAQILPLGQTQF